MKHFIFLISAILTLYYSSIPTVVGAMTDHGMGNMMEDAVSVPEPGATALMGIALLALFIVGKFKK